MDRWGLSAWADQGMLLWAAHRTGNTQYIRSDLTWNCPVQAAQFYTKGDTWPSLLEAATAKGHSVLDEIRHVYPEANIVHWLGIYKLSRQLESEVWQLFVHGLGHEASQNRAVMSPDPNSQC